MVYHHTATIVNLSHTVAVFVAVVDLFMRLMWIFMVLHGERSQTTVR